jgi:hypothetical protein
VIMTAVLSSQLYSSNCHDGYCVIPDDAPDQREMAYNKNSLPWAWQDTKPVRVTAPSWADKLVPWPKKGDKEVKPIVKPPEPEEHYTATDATMANAPAWLKTRWKSKPRMRR